MRLILGIFAIAFLIYGITTITLGYVAMKIPLLPILIIGGVVGCIAAGLAWNQSIKHPGQTDNVATRPEIAPPQVKHKPDKLQQVSSPQEKPSSKPSPEPQPAVGGDDAIATQRPWLEIVGMKFIEPLKITKDEVSIGLGITIKNHGSAPATNVMIIPEMAAVPIKDGMDLEIAIRKALNISKNWESHLSRVGTSLFPNTISEQHTRVKIPKSEIIMAAEVGDDHLRVILSLGGCVDYRFGAGKGQTTFNFVLTEKNTNHLGIEIYQREVPVEKLVLLQQPIGIYAK